MLILEYHLQEILQGTKYIWYTWVIDQACSLDGCLLAKFFFRMFVDQDKGKIYKHTKKRTGQYPWAILIKQASSVKRLYYMEKEHYLCGTVVKIALCCPLR